MLLVGFYLSVYAKKSLYVAVPKKYTALKKDVPKNLIQHV